jgi:RNA polymerase sigma-70 factor (ECF subfamily)
LKADTLKEAIIVEANFSELVDLYSRKVYNLAFRFTGIIEDSEDIVQETFLQVYRHLHDFREESTVYTWIYRIALNNCRHLKKIQTKTFTTSLEEHIEAGKNSIPFEVNEWFNSPEESSLMIELLTEIRQFCYQFLILRLPDHQRVVFIMRSILELSYKDIAEITDTSENIVKARLSRARNCLAKLIAEKKSCCAWQNENSSFCCKSKAGCILGMDQELLRKIKRQAYDAGLISREDLKPVVSRSIDKLFETYPQLESKVENLKERIVCAEK